MCEIILKMQYIFTFFSDIVNEILLSKGSFETIKKKNFLFNSMLIYFLLFNQKLSGHFDINVINLFLFYFLFPSIRHIITVRLFNHDGW